MSDDQQKQPINQALPRFRDPQFRDLYSNVSITSISAFDVVITIQRAAEIAPGQPAIIDQVAITMSPQHFKGFVRSLNETLSAYEQGFGALTISDAETKPLSTADDILKMINNARVQRDEANNRSSLPSTEMPQPSVQARVSSRKKGH